MLKQFIFTFLMINTAAANNQAATQADHSSEQSKTLFQYDIFSEGDDIGDITIHIIKTTSAGFLFHELSHIKASGWWGKIDIISSLSEEFSGDGQLLKVDKKERNGKKAYWTKMQLVDDELWASHSQIKNLSDIEEQQFVDLSVGVLSSMVPNVGEVISISQLLFSEGERLEDNIRINQHSYDTTLAHIPFYWQKQQNKLPAEIMVLDSENLSIHSFKTAYVGVEKIMTSHSDSTKTHHYKMIPQEGKPLDIWMAVDAENVPHFVQLMGEDADGPFHIKVKPQPRG